MTRFHLKIAHFREKFVEGSFRRLYFAGDSSQLYSRRFISYFHYVVTKVSFYNTYSTYRVSENELLKRFYHSPAFEESEVASAIVSTWLIRIFACQSRKVSTSCFSLSQKRLSFCFSFFFSASSIRSSGLATCVSDKYMACFYSSVRVFSYHTA